MMDLSLGVKGVAGGGPADIFRLFHHLLCPKLVPYVVNNTGSMKNMCRLLQMMAFVKKGIFLPQQSRV